MGVYGSYTQQTVVSATDKFPLQDGTSGVTKYALPPSIGDVIVGSSISYIPTLASTVIGNGTLTGKYIKLGKLVYGEVSFTMGSTSTINDATFTLPITAASRSMIVPIGTAFINDVGVNDYVGTVIKNGGASTATVRVPNTASTYAIIGSRLDNNVPFVFGAGDSFVAQFIYEAA